MLSLNLKLLLCSLVFLPAATRAEHIQLIIQEFAPYGYTDPKSKNIQGYLTEKAQEIIRRAGATSSISSTSLARGLQATKTEADTCILNLRRTPDREELYAWVGPLSSTDWVLYGRNSDERILKSIQDAKPFRIGSYKGSATGIELAELGYKIEFAATDDENPNLLMINRIDYWIVAEHRGMYIVQKQGYGADISQVAKYKSIDLYMLCNKSMSRKKLTLFNRINKEIENDGTMQKILRKYGIR